MYTLTNAKYGDAAEVLVENVHRDEYAGMAQRLANERNEPVWAFECDDQIPEVFWPGE